MTDYLFSRHQFVQIDNCNSSLQPCHNGVPQGSILGTLLFLIFFNDFSETLENTEAVIYADDSVIFCGSKNNTTVEEDLTKDLAKIKS